MKRALCSVALSAGVLLAGTACSSSSTPEAATTTTTSTAGSNKSFEVTSEEGQISVSLDGKLPPGWPSSFPVPSTATPAGSGSIGGSSSTYMVGVYGSTGSPQDAYAFYTSQPELTVSSKSAIGSGDRYLATVKFSGAGSGRITILPRNGQTLIIVVLETGSSGSTGTTGTAKPTGTTASGSKAG